MKRPAPRLTDLPFAGLARHLATGTATPLVVRTSTQVDRQHQAILAMHTAAQRQREAEHQQGVVFDTEGRAHDVRTGRYTSRPTKG